MDNHLMRAGWFGILVVVLLTAAALRIYRLDVYPPAISNDEAVNIIDSFHIARTGNIPLYEEDKGRAEPAYRLLLAATAKLWGVDVFSQRVVSAFLGILVAASIYWVTTEALHDLSRRARRLGALTAAIAITVMPGHMTLSRALFRTNLELLVVLMSIGFALRAVRLHRLRDAALAGLFCGFSLYTYTAAWIFPLAYFPLAVSLLLFRRQDWRRWLPVLVVIAGMAFVVALPVLYLAATQPQAVFGRAEDLTNNPASLADRLQSIVEQFYRQADENPQYNIALAPLVSAVWQPIFLLGLGLSLLRIRTRSALFLLAMLLLFNLPAALSNEITHGLRIAKEYLIIAIICGVGVGSLVALIGQQRKSSRIVFYSGMLLVAGLLVSGSLSTWQVYTAYWEQPDEWQSWSVHGRRLDHNQWFYRTDRRDFARDLMQFDTPLLLPRDELQRQTTRTWLLDAYPDVRTIAADDTRYLQLPPDTQVIIPYALELNSLMLDTRQYALLHDSTILLLPPLADDTHTQLIDAARDFESGDNLAAYYSRTLPADFRLQFAPVAGAGQENPLAAFNNGELHLTRWYGNPLLQSGADKPYTLVWSPQARPGHEYASFLQISTQDYTVVAGSEHLMNRWLYPSTVWQPGDHVPDTHLLDIPPRLAPGAYRLNAGIYFASYPPLLATGFFSDDIDTSATIGWLKVPQPEVVTVPASATAVDATVAESVQLEAVEIVRTESGWAVQSYWQSLVERPSFDATIFVHLLDANDEIIAQHDRRPWNGQYPTFIWGEGERVMTTHPLPDVALDGVRMRLGMYTFPDIQNLAVRYDDRQDIFVLFPDASRFVRE